MAERPLIGRGLFLTNGRGANYQRVNTSKAMDTLTEYTCLSISPAFTRVGGKPDHVSSQGKEAIFATHDIYVVPPQSWGDRSDTKHSKCLLLGGRRLNQLTLIPKLKGSGGARAATAQVGPANKRNDTKRCLPIEASLRPGEAIPW